MIEFKRRWANCSTVVVELEVKRGRMVLSIYIMKINSFMAWTGLFEMMDSSYTLRGSLAPNFLNVHLYFLLFPAPCVEFS